MRRAQIKRALRLKRRVHRRKVRYRAIAHLSGRSWSMVYHTLNGRKNSPAVIAAAERLLADGT